MKKRFILAAIIFIFLCGEAYSEEFKIGMVGWEFRPSSIEINAGDKIIWINDDDATHNIVFDNAALGGPTKEEPYKIRVGKDFSWVFTEPGTFSYYCKLHHGQEMVGEVIVKQNK